MKRPTARTLSQFGAVLLIVLTIWVGTYFGVTRGLMAKSRVVDYQGGQKARWVGVDFPWRESSDPFADSSPWEVSALRYFYKPLTFLDGKYTGIPVYFMSQDFF